MCEGLRERNPTNDFECFGAFEKQNVLEHLQRKEKCFGVFEKQEECSKVLLLEPASIYCLVWTNANGL